MSNQYKISVFLFNLYVLIYLINIFEIFLILFNTYNLFYFQHFNEFVNNETRGVFHFAKSSSVDQENQAYYCGKRSSYVMRIIFLF